MRYLAAFLTCFCLACASSEFGQSRPVLAGFTPCTVAPEERELIADWSFVYLPSRWPIVRIYTDGTIEMSGDLFMGGHPLTVSQLSPSELKRFGANIDRLADGLEGKIVRFGMEYKGPHQEIRISRPGREPITLQTTSRFIEARRAEGPIVWGPEFGPTWIKDDGGSRYERLVRTNPLYMAMREVWLELEAELLRMAAESMLPNQEGIIQSRFGHRGGRDKPIDPS